VPIFYSIIIRLHTKFRLRTIIPTTQRIGTPLLNKLHTT
jgi:hypothetical protein